MPGKVRLAVDCGSVTTAAEVVWPDGRWGPLRFDDRPVLASAVFVSRAGRMVAGAQAWHHAGNGHEGLFVPAPVRRIAEDRLTGGGVSAAGVDVMAEDAGGLRLDEQLAASLNGLTPPAAGTVADSRWWRMLATARAAKDYYHRSNRDLSTPSAIRPGPMDHEGLPFRRLRNLTR
jgi:hypothetical protein